MNIETNIPSYIIKSNNNVTFIFIDTFYDYFNNEFSSNLNLLWYVLSHTKYRSESISLSNSKLTWQEWNLMISNNAYFISQEEWLTNRQLVFHVHKGNFYLNTWIIGILHSHWMFCFKLQQMFIEVWVIFVQIKNNEF